MKVVQGSRLLSFDRRVCVCVCSGVFSVDKKSGRMNLMVCPRDGCHQCSYICQMNGGRHTVLLTMHLLAPPTLRPSHATGLSLAAFEAIFFPQSSSKMSGYCTFQDCSVTYSLASISLASIRLQESYTRKSLVASTAIHICKMLYNPRFLKAFDQISNMKIPLA
jgi:hypothetical protein